MAEFGLIVASLLFAVALWFWLRQRRRARGGSAPPNPEAVWVLGQPSPLLTWLRKAQRREPTPPEAIRPHAASTGAASVSTEETPATGTTDSGQRTADKPTTATSVPSGQVPAALTAESFTTLPTELLPQSLDPDAEASVPAPPPPVRVTIEAPPGITVRVTIESVPDDARPVIRQEIVQVGPAVAPRLSTPRVEGRAWRDLREHWVEMLRRQPWLARGIQSLQTLTARLSAWEWLALGTAFGLYLFTRLYALDDFPIYFFADEASIALIGERILQNGFRDAFGTWFPIYFEGAGQRWTPVLTAYFQGLALSFFGKSIVVARATSVLLSSLGVLAVAIMLRSVFKARDWWLSIFALAVMPAWLIHTRTAFEAVTMAAFFACALLCYLLYLERSPRYLYPALVFGAATFYTYSNAQVIVLATAILLALSDWRYHWQQRRTVLRGLALLVVLALPLIVFQLNRPNAFGTHLRELGSFVVLAGPLPQKIQQYLLNLGYGISPQYWFWPNGTDLVRHRMPGVGHIPLVFLPLFLLGVALCLWRVRSSAHRAVLLAALTAPAGAALVGIGVLRVITFVVPATVFIVLGADWLLRRLPGTTWPPRLALLGSAAGVLLFFNSTLAASPYWFSDYGLYGAQYGAKQIFMDTVPKLLRRYPATTIYVSSTWANGPNIFIDFFIPPEDRARVHMRDLTYYQFRRRPLDAGDVLVMTASEYEKARADPRFTIRQVEAELPYPDGSPGFYFTRLEYSAQADAIFAAEQAERQQPVQTSAMIDGQQVTVIHSRFDGGQIADLFDGDTFSLARGMEANPLHLDFRFPQPRALSGVRLSLGTMRLFQISLEVYTAGNPTPRTVTQKFANLPADPTVTLSLGGEQPNVERVVIAILDEAPAEIVNIHVREIVFEE